MKTSITLAGLLVFSASPALGAPNMIERRIWVEQQTREIEDSQCEEKMKQWRCAISDKPACMKAFKEAGNHCRGQVVPDLPEYVDGSDGSYEKAVKIYVECLATEFSKKHILPMAKDKMDAYNECTGVTPRSKPMSPGLQKAMDFSKTQTTFTCHADGYLRKCFGYSEGDCGSLVSKAQLDCTMRWEAEGKKVKDEQPAIEEAGKKITDCALADARALAAKSRKKATHKDCL